MTKLDAAQTPFALPTPPTLAPKRLQARMFRVPRRLDELYELDALLERLPEGTANDERRADLLARRARTRLDFGFSELAVKDMTEAHALRGKSTRAPGAPVPAPSYVYDARLAEALRVDARDRLLSKTNAEQLFSALETSIGLFRLAVKKLAAMEGVPAEHRAWVHGHLAATQTMNFWITISEHPKEAKLGLGTEAFEEAHEHFERAIQLDGSYPWAHRFLAHLHALRGNAGDFEFAIQCLERANAIEKAALSERARLLNGGRTHAGGDGAMPAINGFPVRDNSLPDNAVTQNEAGQSSFQRSLAMLFSYVAVQSDSAEAAHRSIAAGLQALALDPDELHAPHSIAASLFWLANHGPEADRAKHATYLQAALDTAHLHARNTASRASGVLASLALMEGLQQNGDVGQAAAKARRILDGFAQMGIPADLETRAFSYRTPSVALLEKRLASDDAADAQTALLASTFRPMLETLTALLAIPAPRKLAVPHAAGALT